MVVAHYMEAGAALAAAVVNTHPEVFVSGGTRVEDEAGLQGFLARHGIEPGRPVGPADLQRFRGLRDRLHAVFFAADEASTAEQLNAALAEADALPQVIPAEGTWQISFSSREGDPMKDLAARATLGLAALFAETGRSRFGNCSAGDCRDVFIDTSRNRSRRYCSDSCSSRTNVAAFRARKRSG